MGDALTRDCERQVGRLAAIWADDKGTTLSPNTRLVGASFSSLTCYSIHSSALFCVAAAGGGGENLYETPNFRMDGSIFSFSSSSSSPPSVVIFVRCRRRRQNLKLWIIGFGLEKGALLFVGGLWNWKSPPHLLSSDSFLLQSRSDGPTGDTTARGRKCWKEFARQPLPGYTEVLHLSDTY